ESIPKISENVYLFIGFTIVSVFEQIFRFQRSALYPRSPGIQQRFLDARTGSEGDPNGSDLRA
ncbi:MAG: hypothetical protein OXH00_20480, partial [Candidatus Poribacteria bacterium]|nr:hypothetical protein [Candidatus Poribacteria bacterium]